MINRFSRTQRVIGRDALHKIRQAHVIVFGVGGVGGYAIEALARSGIGKIDIVDHDTVSLTNINRQLIATDATIAQYYIIDAIDNVTAKIDLIVTAKSLGIPIISAMGCGNRFDPTKVRVMNIYDTKNDPLAKVMRHELRVRNIKDLQVCCSIEAPIKPIEYPDEEQEKAVKWSIPGSTAFVPPVAGITLAAEVVRQITNFDPNNRK